MTWYHASIAFLIVRVFLAMVREAGRTSDEPKPDAGVRVATVPMIMVMQIASVFAMINIYNHHFPR